MAETYDRSRHFTVPGFPLAVVPIPRQEHVDAHAHRFVELVVILKGSGIHQTEEDEYPIVAGDVFVVPPGVAHTYPETKDCHLVNVLFFPDELGIPWHDLRTLPGYHALFTLEPHYRRQHRFESRLHLGVRDLAVVEHLLERLQSELSAQSPGFRFVATSVLMDLLATVSRCYSRVRSRTARPLLRLGETIGYIEENYAQPITVTELCEVAHMSESSLLRAFRQALDTTPIDYLLRLRVSRAAERLRQEPDETITAVAHATGFNDSNYFSRAFRKVMGESPRAYRKHHKVEDR